MQMKDLHLSIYSHINVDMKEHTIEACYGMHAYSRALKRRIQKAGLTMKEMHMGMNK